MTDQDADSIETSDVVDVLNASAMLVSFHRTAWNGEITDNTVTEGVKQQTGAKGKIGRFRLNLLANNDSKLEAVIRAMSAAYRDHVRLTWPWGNSEQRLLLNTGFMDYMATLQKNKRIIDDALQVFVADYPSAMQAAVQDLGPLADMSKYPTAQDIASRFSIDCDFDPIPAGSQFPGMPPNIGAILQQRLQQKTAARMQGAINETWNQIKSLVQRMANQTTPDGRVHEKTLAKITELPGYIRRFNFMKDAKLDAIANVIAQELCHWSAKSLADDKQRALAHAAAIKVLGYLP